MSKTYREEKMVFEKKISKTHRKKLEIQAIVDLQIARPVKMEFKQKNLAILQIINLSATKQLEIISKNIEG